MAEKDNPAGKPPRFVYTPYRPEYVPKLGATACVLDRWTVPPRDSGEDEK